MKKATYTVTIIDGSDTEAILTEIDHFFIDLERKHKNNVAVSTP
jgi:hypothetical protein